MKMINIKTYSWIDAHPFWKTDLKRWWKKWDFAIMFFGTLACFALLASLDEILKGNGLA
tara:strand:+ start:730 stop:906 length:177 start_codon:yes stop_codon:yes gene_type:complete